LTTDFAVRELGACSGVGIASRRLDWRDGDTPSNRRNRSGMVTGHHRSMDLVPSPIVAQSGCSSKPIP